MAAPDSDLYFNDASRYTEIYDLMPKHPETGLLLVERFVDFVKALAATSAEKNAYQLPARARRQFAGHDHLSLHSFGDCVRGALWTKIEEKVQENRAQHCTA